jgi:putative ABC transport system permease protein
MWWVALRMLTGDRSKYLVIVLGVAFATTMMAHQLSVFLGVMRRSVSQIEDVHPAGIWVMDPEVVYVDEARPLPAGAVERVRGVPGVESAVPLFKGQGLARTERGDYRQVILIGLDDATLTGAPVMNHGAVEALRRPDAVVLDQAGHSYLWPGEPVELGREFHLNDRRAVLVGVCKASPPFLTMPIVYTRLSAAARCAPDPGRSHTFVLVRAFPGGDEREVADRIRGQTGFQALPAPAFARRTMGFYFRNTGIPLNFGIVVSLGFVVGVAVAGQTFYLFTLENLRQFGTLKAMGVTNARVVGMVLTQAAVVGVLGYCLGIGAAAAVIVVTTTGSPHLAGFDLVWPVAGVVAGAVVLLMVCSAAVSVRKVLVLEPARVFRS